MGFTLLELLITIVIIGVLATISIPSFIAQTSKARNTEGKTTLGSINRAQQTFYLEHEEFATALDELDINEPKTGYYDYSIEGTVIPVYGEFRATPKLDRMDQNIYASAVSAEGILVKMILCESNKSAANGGSADVDEASFTCDENSIQLN